MNFSKQTLEILDIRIGVITKNGERVVIETSKGALWQTPKQFLISLQNSFLLPRTIKDIQHPSVLNVLRDIKRGCNVSGSIEFYKAGSFYIADAQSSIVERGDAKVGQKIERTTDGSAIERGTFLSIELHDSVYRDRALVEASAAAYAGLFAFDSNTVDAVPVVETTDPTKEEVIDLDAATDEDAEVVEETPAVTGRKRGGKSEK